MTAVGFPTRFTLAGYFTLWFTLAAAPALDLTPRRGVRTGNEGAPTPVLQFSTGQGRIDYRPPADWTPSGGGHSLVFLTPEPTSWMRLIVVDKTEPAPRDGKASVAPAAADLQKRAASFAPPGAKDLRFNKAVPSPFTLGTQPATEFLFTCTLDGFQLSLSISLTDLNPKESLVMLVCAQPAKFEQMREKAVTSMFTWSVEDQ